MLSECIYTSGGGGNAEIKIIDFSDNVTARTFNNLTVGKAYRVLAETAWVSGSVTFTLSSYTGCTQSVITSFTRVKNSGYNSWLGYIEYEITPSATSITLTFDRGDVQHFTFYGENASQITKS